MGAYRNQYDILARVLTSAQSRIDGQNLTHLMYDSNTSYPQITDFIALLKAKGLLTEILIAKHPRYEITPKGSTYLKVYASLISLVR